MHRGIIHTDEDCSIVSSYMELEFLVHSSDPTQSYILNYKYNKRKYFHLDKENYKQFFKTF